MFKEVSDAKIKQNISVTGFYRNRAVVINGLKKDFPDTFSKKEMILEIETVPLDVQQNIILKTFADFPGKYLQQGTIFNRPMVRIFKITRIPWLTPFLELGVETPMNKFPCNKS